MIATRIGGWAVGAVALALIAPAALGQLVFDPAGSSVTFRHIENFGSSTSRTNSRQFFFNNSALASAFDFSNLYTVSTSNTTGKAGVDPVTNLTTASFRLPSGTGVAQVNPSPKKYSGYSEVQIALDMRWNVGSLGVSTTIVPYSSYSIAGSVGTGSGAFARLIQDITVRYLTESNVVLKSADLDADQSFTTAGSFSLPVTRSSTFTGGNGPLAPNTKLNVSGTIKFRAKNDGSPSDIILLDGELGGNASLYTGVFGATGSWQDPANWLPSVDLPAGTFPNGPVRARLVATDLNTDARTITLDAPVQLDELEVDDLDSVTISPAAPANGLTFNATNPRLVHGNANGNGQLVVNAPVTFAAGPIPQPSVIRSDSTGGMVLNGQLSAGSTSLLSFEGTGPITINGSNAMSLTSPVTVSGRSVTANVSGALGSGPLTISNGLLNAATFNPSTDPGPVTITAGGQYSFIMGFTPALSETFIVDELSGVSGTPSQLNALVNGTNVTLAPGAMIVHRSFSPLISPTQDIQNLGVVPQYIYGIGTNFTGAGSLGIGSGISTPYIGFGADRGLRTFGDHPNPGTGPSTSASVLSLTGSTTLAALPSGQLILNRQLIGSGTVDVAGGGIVTLNNGTNAFMGTLRVKPDTVLEVNGAVSMGTTIEVQGTLAGKGNPIVGTVSIQAGGVLSPGGPDRGFMRTGQLQLGTTAADATLKFTVDRPDTSDFLFVQGAISGQATIQLDARPGFDAGIYELIDYKQNSPPTAIDAVTVPPDFQAEVAMVPRVGQPGGRAVLVVTPVGLDVGSWNSDIDLSDYSNPANWNGPVPNAPGAVANFGPVTSAYRFLLLESPITLGTVNVFTNQGYAIASNGGGSITIDGVLDQAGFNISGGDVSLFVPVHFQTSPRIGGTGDFNFFGPLSADPGARLTKYGPGPLRMSSLRFEALDVTQGHVEILPNPGGPNSTDGASKLSELLLAAVVPAPPGTSETAVSLDVGNNALVIDYDGASPLNLVRQWIQTGRGTGNWNAGTTTGARINSRTLREYYAGGSVTVLQSLALVEAGDLELTSFAGQTLDSTSLLIAFTVTADTNLDFVVDLNDFTALAAGFGQPGNWNNGDFNFDGTVSLDDFTLMAANFGQVLPAGLPKLSAVPEPTCGLIILAIALHRRRV